MLYILIVNNFAYVNKTNFLNIYHSFVIITSFCYLFVTLLFNEFGYTLHKQLKPKRTFSTFLCKTTVKFQIFKMSLIILVFITFICEQTLKTVQVRCLFCVLRLGTVIQVRLIAH